MAQVKRPNGQIVQVKNLGWLLRNWQTIERLEWVWFSGGKGSRGQELAPPRETMLGVVDGVFRAHMRDGSVYATIYASFEVWKGFINRPIFRGLKVTVNGIDGIV